MAARHSMYHGGGEQIVAYNGGMLKLGYWPYPCIVDLRGMSGIDKSRPVLRDHDTAQIVGHTSSIKIAGKTLTAAGVISGAGEASKEIVATAANGFPWQASIGARVLNREFVQEGSTVQCNGETFNGPCYVARKTILGEISFVALGADDDTSARIAANKAAERTPMKEFAEWLKAKGFVLADLNDQSKAFMQAQYDAEKKAAEKKDDPEDTLKASAGDDKLDPEKLAADVIKATRAAASTEQKRIADIGKICIGHPDINAKAIAEGWDVQKAELEVLRAARPTGGPYINTGAGQDMTQDLIAAAGAMTAGVSEKAAFKGLTDNQKEIASSRKMRGMGLHQMMAIIAASAGIPFTPGRVDNESLRAILHHDQMTINAAGGGFSTMSLSGITENILNKAMLESYGSVVSVVQEFCFETDTNDFKQFKRYRLTGKGAFTEVGTGGELQNMSMQDETYANQVKTQGAIIGITRQILINDDMGALVQAPQLIGRQSAIAREKAVFTTLIGSVSVVAPGAPDGTANAFNFFSSGAKNYLSGSGYALAIATMATARKMFVEQKDANGDPIMVMPDRILVPPALETTADNLFSGANIVVGALGATNAKTTEPNLNAHRNKYRPITSPWLGANSPLYSSSNTLDTDWYLLANPAGGMAPVQIGYLRGQRTPIIERGEANFNTLGIMMRGYYDFGVALHDYRTAVLMRGA